jgi:hypothetical protein
MPAGRPSLVLRMIVFSNSTFECQAPRYRPREASSLRGRARPLNDGIRRLGGPGGGIVHFFELSLSSWLERAMQDDRKPACNRLANPMPKPLALTISGPRSATGRPSISQGIAPRPRVWARRRALDDAS